MTLYGRRAGHRMLFGGLLAGIFAFSLAPPAVGQTPELTDTQRELLRKVKTIRLLVHGSSWRGKPDWSDLDPRSAFDYYLAEVGFKVVPPEAARYDATVTANWQELESPGYSLSPAASGGGLSGKRIECSIEVTHPQVGRILEFTIRGSTPIVVDLHALDSSAVQEFRRDPSFLLFGVRVARAFGTQNHFGATSSRLIQMLQDPTHRLAAALALGELKDPVAVGPLAALLTTAEYPHTIRTAARSLAEIGDTKALTPLRRFADETSDPDVRDAVRQAIAELEKK